MLFEESNATRDLDGNTNLGNNDIVLVKYNSSGDKQWSKLLGGSKSEQGHSIATDSSNNIYLTGETWGDFGVYTNSGKQDMFLMKLNSSGVLQ